MNSEKSKLYFYDPRLTSINRFGILDQKMGYIVKFRPHSSNSRSNQYLSVGERDILKLEFKFYENEGVVLKVKRGWSKHGKIYLYCSKWKAIKQFHCIMKTLYALGFTTYDLT